MPQDECVKGRGRWKSTPRHRYKRQGREGKRGRKAAANGARRRSPPADAEAAAAVAEAEAAAKEEEKEGKFKP